MSVTVNPIGSNLIQPDAHLDAAAAAWCVHTLRQLFIRKLVVETLNPGWKLTLGVTILNVLWTRMHSSRMRTVRNSSRLLGGGCTWSRGCTWSWGVYLVPGGVYLVAHGWIWSWGCIWSWGVYLVPGGVGVYLVVGGVPGPRGVPAQVLPR